MFCSYSVVILGNREGGSSMNTVRRTIKSIINLKKRTYLIGTLFLVISVFLIASSSIQSALNDALSQTKKQLNPILTIELDYEKVFQSFSSSSSSESKEVIDEELIQKIENSKYVKDFSVHSEIYGSTQYEEEDTNRPSSIPKDLISPSNSIGIHDTQNPILASKKITLKEGEYPEDSNKNTLILISEKYAKNHNLKVGDTLDLDFNSSRSESTDKLKRTATISGIYVLDSDNAEAYIKNEEDSFFATRTFVGEINQLLMGKDMPLMAGYSKVKIELNDPMDAEKLVQSLKDGNDSKYPDLLFKSSYMQYKTITAMIDGFTDILQKVQLAFLLFGGILLALIMILSLRERKHELGLLLSLGETKSKIILQMFLEIAIVFLISTGTGIALSEVLVIPKATAVINNQLEENFSELQREEEGKVETGPNYVKDTSVELKTEVSIEPPTPAENIAASSSVIILLLSVILITTTIPTAIIIRQSPKTILSGKE